MFSNIVKGEHNEELSFFKNFDKGFKQNYMMMVISYFNGSDLLHIFARLNKSLRAKLPNSGLLDQQKVLRVKQDITLHKILQKIKYGVKLVDKIDFLFNGKLTEE